MSLIGDISGLGAVATAIDSILGKFIPDANAREQAKTEIAKVQADAEKARMDDMAAVMSADSKSESWYTRAARPTVVYWSLCMVTIICVASLAGHSKEILDALKAVPSDMWDMIRQGVGIYTAGRSAEKVSTVIAKALTAKRG